MCTCSVRQNGHPSPKGGQFQFRSYVNLYLNVRLYNYLRLDFRELFLHILEHLRSIFAFYTINHTQQISHKLHIEIYVLISIRVTKGKEV